MQLAELKTQALRYVVLGDPGRALAIYAHLVGALPTDLDARMKIADLLVSTGMHDLARRVYAALVFYDLQLGRPLHAIVCAHALHALGEPLEPLFQPLASRYAAEANSLAAEGRGLGVRLAPPDPTTEVGAPHLPQVADAATLRFFAEQVAERAASTTDLGQLPDRYPPMPLLSELPQEAFLRLLSTAIVRRVPAGTPLVKEGEPGTSFFLVASGRLRVYAKAAATQAVSSSAQELARLGEGAIFGELALVSAQPRGATVEATEETDVVEIGCAGLRALADELPRVAEVLNRYTRDRMIKNLLATSPLFRPFSPQQRLDLARRFTGHELAPGTEVIREGQEGRGLFVVLAGELEVSKGEEPFATSIAMLRGGDLFGEISLLHGTPATATVRATTAAAVLFLSREYFERLVTALPEIRAFFEGLSEDRLRVLKQREDPAFLDGAEDAEAFLV